MIGLAAILIFGAFGWLTFGPKPTPPAPPVLTEEAKAYLPSLALSNVHMQAAESYVQSAADRDSGRHLEQRATVR